MIAVAIGNEHLARGDIVIGCGRAVEVGSAGIVSGHAALADAKQQFAGARELDHRVIFVLVPENPHVAFSVDLNPLDAFGPLRDTIDGRQAHRPTPCANETPGFIKFDDMREQIGGIAVGFLQQPQMAVWPICRGERGADPAAFGQAKQLSIGVAAEMRPLDRCPLRPQCYWRVHSAPLSFDQVQFGNNTEPLVTKNFSITSGPNRSICATNFP